MPQEPDGGTDRANPKASKGETRPRRWRPGAGSSRHARTAAGCPEGETASNGPAVARAAAYGALALRPRRSSAPQVAPGPRRFLARYYFETVFHFDTGLGVWCQASSPSRGDDRQVTARNPGRSWSRVRPGHAALDFAQPPRPLKGEAPDQARTRTSSGGCPDHHPDGPIFRELHQRSGSWRC